MTREEAVAYWQDSLAKFFPTAKGPTNVEIDMFIAGAEKARKAERERILHVLANNTDSNIDPDTLEIIQGTYNESCGAI